MIDFPMNRRAQAGLEYLMTYGWALVLVATIIGVLIFVIATPAAQVRFSSDSAKILVKSSSVASGGGDDSIDLVLQNITGMDITVNSVSFSGGLGNSDNATLNGDLLSAGDIGVSGGSEMRFEDLDAPTTGAVDGSMTISYTNALGLQKSASITSSDTTSGGAGTVCGNGSCESGEECAADCTLESHCSDGVNNDGDGEGADCDDSDCYSDSACIVVAGLVIDEVCDWTGLEDIDAINSDYLSCGDCEYGSCDGYRLVFTDGPEEDNVFTINTSNCGGCWDPAIDCFAVPGLNTVPDGACGPSTDGEYVGPPWYFDLIVPHS